MRTLPPKMVQLLAPFAPLFSKRVWQNIQLLLVVLTDASTIMAT
jgi:leucyl-tRNA synthetase